jgi:hypothetical protein
VRAGRRRAGRLGCMRCALVSVGWPGGTTAGVDSPPMSPGRPRNEGRSASPPGTAPSGRWRKASNLPVLKHGPRSITCMRAGGRKTHEAQGT